MAVRSGSVADLRMVMRRFGCSSARAIKIPTSRLAVQRFSSRQHAFSMITRRGPTCLSLTRQPLRLNKSRHHGAFQKRSATTSSAPAATPAGTNSSASQLAIFTNELDKLSPRFGVSADSIEILRSPSEFYETLKVRGEMQRREFSQSKLIEIK